MREGGGCRLLADTGSIGNLSAPHKRHFIDLSVYKQLMKKNVKIGFTSDILSWNENLMLCRYAILFHFKLHEAAKSLSCGAFIANYNPTKITWSDMPSKYKFKWINLNPVRCNTDRRDLKASLDGFFYSDGI